MRSGFGPGRLLRRAGVEVARDLPGVGENLQEHPAVGLSCFVRHGHRLADGIFHQQSHVRFSSGLEGCPPTDMSMSLLARSAWHRVGGQIATYYIWVNKSYSQGYVRLQPSDASAPPEVDFRLLSDPRDLTRLRAGLRRIAAIALDPRMDNVRTEVFPTVFSARVQSVSRPGPWNAARTAALATILDFAGFARRYLIHKLIAPKELHELLADDAVLDEYMHAAVAGVWHACGSCRMGRADDPLAVTDSQGRVHNVPGLRVCDASLMPMVPCANTNIPTIMIAERIADLTKAAAREGAQPARAA
jgi:5-(hydroxymethyl)furfural/furfural oxidase